MTGAKRRFSGLRASDLRGVAQLATQATSGAARVAEGVARSVWDTLGVPGATTPGKTNGITGFVFDSIQGITQLAGKSADLLFAKLLPLLQTVEATPPDSYPREAVLAALNGVLGDRLQASANPLAMDMSLRCHGRALDCSKPLVIPGATPKVLVLIHGLCMNDLQWETRHLDGSTSNHGTLLASALGYTPVYVRYNTGLHTSINGRDLAAQLEQLAVHWPVPVQDISVLAHSMGGLVVRSAMHLAQTSPASRPVWFRHLKNVVFLGTPHHGAPLEKAGNWVDVLLGSTPYTKPFAKLGQLRSAGITDLRYGHVVDSDWVGHDRFRRKPDSRLPVPLPEGVACYTVAATVASQRGTLAERIMGDGLVPLDSALGVHPDGRHSLQFARPSQWIAYGMNHMDLLGRPEIGQKLVNWLAPPRSLRAS